MARSRKQRVDLVGFLRSQLSGLQGVPTLCYELIQNADDVKDLRGNPGAKRISFDVCDDALWVENDGVFRTIDFDRMERVSWGDKRNEADTTGTFGIGFTAVYQITDAPEIYSGGEHWTFKPTEDGDIDTEECETEFTRFRLPWAFELSKLRQDVGIPPVGRDDLDRIADQIVRAVGQAALFLKQIALLEVKRNGAILCRIEVAHDGDQLLVEHNRELTAWLLLDRHFDDSAIREQYVDLIEPKKRTKVQLAVPESPLQDGLLYAFLPSETNTELPFHINADFYPSSDRKRIVFEGFYKGEWNRLAIQCAEEALADGIGSLIHQFSPNSFWEFADRVKRVSTLPATEYSGFWPTLVPKIRAHETAMLLSGARSRPSDTLLLGQDDQNDGGPILSSLGLPVAHPDLRPYRNLLLETGARPISITDVVAALKHHNYTQRTLLAEMPATLQAAGQWLIFWRVIEDLVQRWPVKEHAEAKGMLKDCALLFGTDGAVWPPNQLFEADENTRTLFGELAPIVWLDVASTGNEFMVSLAPRFGLSNGIERLVNAQSLLQEKWEKRDLDLAQLYDWLEGYRNEIAGDGQTRDKLRRCAIWPAADGTLQALEQRYLPGDFEDPIGLAQLIDVAALGGRHEFLERALKVEKLDLVTYLRDLVPPALAHGEMCQAHRLGLLRLLAENIGKLQGQHDLQSRLSKLPLIWCGQDKFLPPDSVYARSETIRLLFGNTYPTAEVVPDVAPAATEALYEWLGLTAAPRPEHVLAQIRRAVNGQPNENSLRVVANVFDYLASNWSKWKSAPPHSFEELKKLPWLPASKNPALWFAASEVNAPFSKSLFESQGNFLQIDLKTQQKGRDLFAFLEILSEPTPMQMAKHLLYSSERGRQISQEIYQRLNSQLPSISPEVIDMLRDCACLFLRVGSGEEKYVKPSCVFWDEHPFGKYRYRLSLDFGGYKDLLDKLGVRAKPNAQDAIDVLLEISCEFGRANTPLDTQLEVAASVIECWRLITTSLEAGSISRETVRQRLCDEKTIIDPRNILERPSVLFFDDRPSWGTRFELLENNQIKLIDGVWPAMQTAGVRRLSEVVETSLQTCTNQTEDLEIVRRLQSREALLRRVIEAYKDKVSGSFDLETATRLTFVRGDQLEVVRTFLAFGRPFHTTEPVKAIRVENTIYFTLNSSQYPWLDIASELSYVLYSSGELNSLGLEIREVLSAATLSEANKILDRLGYPPSPEVLDAVHIDSPSVSLAGDTAPTGLDTASETQVVDGSSLGGSAPTQSDTNSVRDADTGNSQPTPANGSASGGRQASTHVQNEYHNESAARAERPSSERRSESRSTSRLHSYACLGDEPGSKQDQASQAWDRNETGQKGVDRVLKYEREQGRDPLDMETIQTHHPGYDVKSVDAEGQVRFIEVKTLSGTWSSPNPAQMTANEFREALRCGDTYWLYVVERVGMADERLYIVRGPARKADYFLFDHGWMSVAEAV